MPECYAREKAPWGRSGVVSSLSSVLPTSQVFTSGYVNTETILNFFYEITNDRGTKTVFTYAHVKWFYVYYLNYFINAKYNLTQETKEAHNVSLIDKNSLNEKK